MSNLVNGRKAAEDIAEGLFRDLKAKRLRKIGLDEARSAVVGFNSCLMQFDKSMTNQQVEDMEILALRRIVMKCR